MITDRYKNPGKNRMQWILLTAWLAACLTLPVYGADTEAGDPVCTPPTAAGQTERGTETNGAMDPSVHEKESNGAIGKTEQGKEPPDPGRQDPGRETEKGTEKGTEKSTEKGTEECPEDPGREPEGSYTLILKDIHADLPEEGRIYDGTDRIDLAYTVQIESAAEEEEDVPPYTLNCEAHLDGCDAGERTVLYSFSLQTPYPDHIRLKEDQEYPPLTVEVKRAVLQVRISDGTKPYMDPADLEHIDLIAGNAVEVTGFVKDDAGKDIIPEGFQYPEITVDREVLSQDSPMYRKGALIRYEKALILKKTKEGNVTGDPTGNYEFSCDPEDDRYVPGTVTVTEGSIREGEAYTVEGEAGAWLPDGEGGLILRAGTRLYVDPCRGTGYNTGVVSEKLQGDGWYTFRLQKKDRKGHVTAESEEAQIHYVCDASAPAAVLSVAGAAGEGDIRYTASEASVTADVPADDRSGVRSVRYRLLRGDLRDDADLSETRLLEGAWQDAGSSMQTKLTQEGIFRIEWEVTDGVGNTNRTVSPLIVVDHTAPQITILGVTENGSHAGEVIITVSCRDASYRSGSLRTHMTAAYRGQIPDCYDMAGDTHGATVRFADFQHSAQADTRYTLQVRAQDLAGNEAVRSISFTINRFGSSYRLGRRTQENLQRYYHTEPFAVCFTETNPSPVTSAGICILKDSVLTRLTPGREGCTVKTVRVREGYRYTYTVPAEVFRGEGRYEVLLLSEDAAGNASDSAAQGIRVRFVIDRTAPECLISGIRTGGRYNASKLTAAAEVRDNIALSEVRIYRDSILYRTLDEETLAQEGGVIKLPFTEKKEWQTLQIYAADCAGNECWTQEYVLLVRRDASDVSRTAPKKRLSARQIQLAWRWIGTWRSRIRKLFLQDRRAAGLQEQEKAGLEATGTAVRAGDLERRRLRAFLGAACVVPAIPALYLLIRFVRGCAGRRRRRKPVDRRGADR